MKKRYITLPETWDELTEADWRELLKIRHWLMTTNHRCTVEDVRIETARRMLKNRGLKSQPTNDQYLVLVSQLGESLTWLWQELDGGLSLVYRSTYNLLPGIGRKGERENPVTHKKEPVYEWIGPQSHGADLTFGEFRMAMAIMKNYEQNPSERDLNVLAGLLYRHEASEQMQREQQLRRCPYDWDNFEQKELRGQQMKRWQVWGIYAWFAYFCEHLTTGIFTIDGTDVSFAPLFDHSEGKKETSEAKGGNSLTQICLTLAESHVFGTMKEVDHTPLLTVMLKLLQDYNTLQRIKNKK